MIRVDASPVQVELPVGEAAEIAVTVTNSSSLIDAYVVRTYGLDLDWVHIDPPRLSLFPGQSATATIGVRLPEQFPAGVRQLAIQVESENDSADFSLAAVDLHVGSNPQTTLRVDPVSVVGGNSAVFSLVIENNGNTTVAARPAGVDPEALTTITFDPPLVELPPARRDTVQANVKGGRPWFGQPKVRVLTFDLGPGTVPALATFVQRPRIHRWLISLLGLVTVAAVFAAVLSRTFDDVVDEATVDNALLNEALSEGGIVGANVPVNPGSITGKVVALTSNTGVAGVQADLFLAGDGAVPIATAATGKDGAFAFGRLEAGKYRVRFSGAGFDVQWYPAKTTFADAVDITVTLSEPTPLAVVRLGGRPGSVRGEVVADDPTGAVATLVVTPGSTEPDVPAEVLRVDVSADGEFVFEQVPSPAEYQLIVEKPGLGSEQRRVLLSAGQDIEDIVVVLRGGAGVISGQIQSPEGALGGVTVVATDGELEVSTVSLTEGTPGFFAVRGLAAPGLYTVTFSRDGYTSETRTVELDPSGQSGPLAINLTRTRGSISGITRSPGGAPLGGITVTVVGGDVTVVTTTASIASPAGAIGTYRVEDLPMPATYTVTFSGTGLLSQTRLEDLDSALGRGDLPSIDATMVSSTATIRGTVSTSGGPVALATVTLTGGTNVRTTLSAHDPLGGFEFTGIPPGTYTVNASRPGSSPAIALVNVVAAEVADVTLLLQVRASVTGLVQLVDAEGVVTPFANATVRLFVLQNFPGGPTAALETVTTDATGRYRFVNLDAPATFVVAVYASSTAADPLDSEPVQTQPSTEVPVPTFTVSFQ
jgi:hypothetical protein